jgi:hypothetical protein
VQNSHIENHIKNQISECVPNKKQERKIAMRSLIVLLTVVALLSLSSGCCLKFSDLTPGTTYNVGDTITTSRTNIVVERFQWSGGAWTSNGRAGVDNRQYAQGTGNDLTTDNTNLNFQFDYPIDSVSFRFGDLGGNINIRVNGNHKNEQNFINLNGSLIGGVQMTVDAFQQGNNWYGKVVLDGTINDFAVGGQELWLDDICPDP